MAKSIANVEVATDTFASWVGKTNQICDTITYEVVTANTSVNGANTVGNTNIIGIFGANTIAVGNALRGGTVNAAANLAVTSNVFFTGSNVAINSNTYISNDTSIIQAVTAYVNGTSLSISSNTAVTGNLVFSGSRATFTGNVLCESANTTLNSTITNITSNTLVVSVNTFTVSSSNLSVSSPCTFNGEIIANDPLTIHDDIILNGVGKITAASNADLGSTTGSPLNVFSWPKATYTGASVVSSVSNISGSIKRVSHILAITTTSDSYLTEYAALHSPPSSNLGVFSITGNTSHAILQFTPTVASESMLLNVTLMA